jgi:protein-S-isoprenylcysteine O-methyltransferase Ste14
MPYQAVALLWFAFIFCWLAAARSVKATRWRESMASRISYSWPVLLFAITALLLRATGVLPTVLTARFYPWSQLIGWFGVAVTAAGLGFSVWARIHLGRNWSGSVTVKEGHELVRTGPYRRVRHPIYTGVILGIAGTALALDNWGVPVALVAVVLAFVRKLHLEEARMTETFPDYANYRRETAALFPFIY